MGAPPFGYVQVDESLGDIEQEATKQFYDKEANAYFERTQNIRRVPVYINEFLFNNSTEGEVLLDLGCGYGAFFEEMPQHLRYIGIDCSPNMIAIGKRQFLDLDLRVGDVCDLEAIVPEKVDYFLASMVFGHIARINLPRALSGLGKRLRPGGRGLILTYFHERSYFLSCEEIGMEGDGGLIQGGFDEISMKEHLNAHGFSMGAIEHDEDQGIMYVEVNK